MVVRTSGGFGSAGLPGSMRPSKEGGGSGQYIGMYSCDGAVGSEGDVASAEVATAAVQLRYSGGGLEGRSSHS